MNRFILTEDERRNISKLHKSYITEQAVQDVAVQPGVYNEKVKQLQDHLNTNFKSGLVPDGKLGPKTLIAAQAALTKAGVDNSKTTQPVAATTVQPVAATTEVQPSTQQQFGVNKNDFNLNADDYTKNPFQQQSSLKKALGLNN